MIGEKAMRILNNLTVNKGSTIIIFSCSLIMVLVLSALVTDLGYIAAEKYKLANTADAAALAGAQDLHAGRDIAIAQAKAYVLKNQSELSLMEITVSDDNRAITVKLGKTVDYFFMRVVGYDSRQINVRATAVISSVGAYKGVRPFGIEKQEFVFGQDYVLKEGAGDGENGNYGGLALGGKGAANYRNLIINGYESELRVGDLVQTEPGNMAGPTRVGIEYLISQCKHTPACTHDNYAKGCPRIIVVPVIEFFEVCGRSTCRIVGFASFFIKDCVNSGGHTEVVGCFIKNAVTSSYVDESISDFGTVGMKLVR